jgi:hypothetical protein
VPNEIPLDALRDEMRRLDADFERLRQAYYRRELVDGPVPTYDDLRLAAEAFINASYRYQRARYGRIRLRLSVSKLLR